MRDKKNLRERKEVTFIELGDRMKLLTYPRDLIEAL
jgi:hypothetical protein